MYITFIGNVLKIDHKLFSSLIKDDGRKKMKMNKNAKHVTPTKLAKCLNMYTIRLIIRPTYYDSDEKKFKPKPEILFCSNRFEPGKLLFIIICVSSYRRYSS